MKKYLVVLFILASTWSIAQDSTLLSLDRLFGSGEFRSQGFGPIGWLEEGNAFTTLEKSESVENARDIVRYDCENMNRRILVAAQELIPDGMDQPLTIEAYSWSNNGKYLLIFTNSKRVWRANTRGDYWILDLDSRHLEQLGKDLPESSLMFAKFHPDDTHVAYVSEFNVYFQELHSGRITQLTTDGNEVLINGTFDWVYEEEFSCRDGFRWSPQGSMIAYWQVDASGLREFFMINNTDSIYSQIVPVQYPKVGEPPSGVKIGVINLANKITTWMNIPGDPVQHYLPRMQWISESKLLVQQLNRKQNHYRMFIANPRTGEVKLIYEEENDSWIDIDHPDLTMSFLVTDLPQYNDHTVLRTSDQDGWRHLYSIDLDSKKVKLLSPGEYEIARYYSIRSSSIYISASPENGSQRYLYTLALDGSGKWTKRTPAEFSGVNRYNIAPNGKYAIHSHSNANTPNTIRLISLPTHRTIKVLQDNAEYKAKIASIAMPEVEFFKVKTEDGIDINGKITKPVNFDPTKQYPVLFNVYGEPWGQTTADSWGSLWNVMLAQKGYCIINIDPRGTPVLNGTKWRKSIYRNIGRVNIRDMALAAKEIIKWDFIDPERVAVWGWSGGGSSTLNLMFQYPELFQTGMSVAPVAYQLYYDNIYQERYMGLPQENKEDFIAGSPVTYVEGLKGNLLLIHGTADDNVHYQNSEAMINALIKANKQFSFMAYPNRSHGIYEGANTSRHLYTLLSNYLYTHCPPGAREKGKMKRS